MRKKDVKIGALYVAKVSNKETVIQILGINPHGGWFAENKSTGRPVYIKTAGRLREHVR